jgi:TonB family protein
MAIHRGDLLLAVGKTAEAGRWYNADSVEARAARAILNRFSRSNIETVRALDRTSREQPNNGLVQFHFGSMEVEAEKDRELQVTALERAVQLLPKLGRAYAELARVYTLTGKADKALPVAERAIELEPEYADRFYEIRAEVFLGLKRLDDALQSIQFASTLPHKDRSQAELYERKVTAMVRRIENVRREAEAERADELRNQVVERAAQLDPPKPVPQVERRREGSISYQIEARAPVEVVDQFFPEYLDALVQGGKAGNITLNVTIGVDGHVTNATVASSQVPELNASTIETAKRWVFKPVILSGRPAPLTIRLIFQYVVQ